LTAAPRDFWRSGGDAGKTLSGYFPIISIEIKPQDIFREVNDYQKYIEMDLWINGLMGNI
jgi:uncharacterized protein YdbL (DUF1318 family)